MHVNDLWTPKNIMKFLGGCKLLRDKHLIIKLAEEKKK